MALMVLGLYTTEQVADYFEVKQSTVRQWVKQKKLKAFKIENKLFFEPLYLKIFADERSRNRKIKITCTVVV
jgi:excisionase family DNA binding protein